MTPKDRLLSWRQQPPKTPEEAATAKLLQEIRSVQTLSPEALARIERKVREGSRRPSRSLMPAFAAMLRPSMMAGAAGTLLVVGGITFVALEQRPPTLEPSLAKVEETPVRGPAEPVVEAKRKADSAPSKLLPPSKFEHKDLSQLSDRLQPLPSPSAAGSGAFGAGLGGARAISRREPNAGVPLPKTEAESLPEPALASRGAAKPSEASAPEARSADSAMRAAPLSAPAALGGPRSVAPPSDEALLQRAEQLAQAGRCADAIEPFSVVAENPEDGPLVERALFGRARCHLALRQNPEAREDLEVCLSRFPSGRFAAQARALLSREPR